MPQRATMRRHRWQGCVAPPLSTAAWRCARLVSNAIPEVRTLSLPGGRADELAHAVSSRQGFTACADPGAIALRAVSVHYGHHRKRRTESGARTSAEEHHERTGKQFPRTTGYRTRIRADLSFG